MRVWACFTVLPASSAKWRAAVSGEVIHSGVVVTMRPS